MDSSITPQKMTSILSPLTTKYPTFFILLLHPISKNTSMVTLFEHTPVIKIKVIPLTENCGNLFVHFSFVLF